MCMSKPQAPAKAPLPPPPPPPPSPTPMSPVIDPATKDKLLLRPRSRGLQDLMVGLNVPKG